MKLLKVNSKWFSDSDLRLDAEFHLSEGPATLRMIKKNPLKNDILKGVAHDVFKGQIFKRCYVKTIEKGFPFLTASDMIKLDITSGTFLSKKYTSAADFLKLESGWILVSRSGTLGVTTYTNKIFEGIIGTDDLIRIKPDPLKIRPGFLYAFLASKYGYSLLIQSSYGGVVKHIEPHHIENLLVPSVSKKMETEIAAQVDNSSELKVKASELFHKAIKLLEDLIGHSDVNLSFQFGVVKKSEINSFKSRLDGQYLLARKKLSKSQSNKFIWKDLSFYAKDIFVGTRGKRMYVKNGIPFLSSSDMILFNSKKYSKNISKNTPGLKNMLVNKKDILISRSGTVGKTILVGSDLDGAAISEHALRLVIDNNKISPEYVFCFLNTKRGKIALESSAFGSVIITLNEEIIGNIMIPEIDKKNLTIITNLINQYQECIDKAVLLENNAVSLIEKEIESWQK